MSITKQASSSPGFLVHNDLKEKLIIGYAILGTTWTGFAHELAQQLEDVRRANSVDGFNKFAEELNGRISKVRGKAQVKNQATYDLIKATSKFLKITGKSNEFLAQISVKEYFALLPNSLKQDMNEAINLPNVNPELINVGLQCGLSRGAPESVPEQSRKGASINEELHPIYLDIGKFEFCDLDKHDVDEVQKYMYFDSGAVNNWGALISDADNSYPNYRHCKQSLSMFLGDSYWQDLVENNQISRTINLGAGTPEKDRAIISSCTTVPDGNHNISLPAHYIIDSSLYMLIDTIKELCFPRYHSRKITATEIITVSGDFMQLSKLIPRDGSNLDVNAAGRSAYFMLGGTIGNINPMRFMDSVLSVANKGDLLIVSGEFLPDSETEISSYMERATAQYNHRLAKQLVAPAARAVLRSNRYAKLRDKNEADDTIISRIQATSRIENNTHNRLQRILKIVFKYKNSGTEFDVVEANRYVEHEFINFVADYAFSYVQQFGVNQPKQLVFEKH